MGQLVGVREMQSGTPGVLLFELNRSLSGMGHEHFTSVVQAIGPRPSAKVARLLLETGKVASVHVYGNLLTVEGERGYEIDDLGDLVRTMYEYWKPGVEPPVFEDAEPEAASDAPAAGADGVQLTGAAARVPAHLLERSRLARERWAAKHAG